MERLVTSSQAAEILGLSLQGVHYRIRTNKLRAVKKDGKTYVYITDDKKKIDEQIAQISEMSQAKTTKRETSEKQTVLTGKDEQINLLKKTIKWIKRQHASEIQRLEANQNKIIEVFNSEIKLLQSAFNEMRAIYKPQLEQNQAQTKPQSQEQTQNQNQNDVPKQKFCNFETFDEKYISLPDFTIYLKKHNKSDRDIKDIVLGAVKQKDRRFIYNKKTKKILIINSDFSDLV